MASSFAAEALAFVISRCAVSAALRSSARYLASGGTEAISLAFLRAFANWIPGCAPCEGVVCLVSLFFLKGRRGSQKAVVFDFVLLPIVLPPALIDYFCTHNNLSSFLLIFPASAETAAARTATSNALREMD